MLEYKKFNVNPHNRKTGDCSTRALVGVLGISYEEALLREVAWSIKTGYDPTSKEVMERVLGQFGYIKVKQPRKRDGKKYMVCELDQITTQAQRENGILVTVANHHTCVIGELVQDIWDCRWKTVGNYYVKA